MSKMLMTVLITGLLVGGGTYWYAKNTTTPNTISSGTVQSNTGVVYKDVFDSNSLDGFNFKIPSTWSIFSCPDCSNVKVLATDPFLSVGQKDVAIGDLNWSQVDFYSASDKIADQLVAEAKKTDPSHWTKETVGSIVADVYTSPLDDNGQVSKGGTGGKDYYLTLDNSKAPYRGTLVIRKQAKGDADFESGFQYLIQTFKITQ